MKNGKQGSFERIRGQSDEVVASNALWWLWACFAECGYQYANGIVYTETWDNKHTLYSIEHETLL